MSRVSERDRSYRLAPEAFELIVNAETGGRAHYERHLRRPSWPGGASGVTVGVGYDLGYVTAGEIEEDWGPHMDEGDVAFLAASAGLRGEAAREWLARRRARAQQVEVSWPSALAVWEERTLPKYVALTRRALPGWERLPARSQGALVSVIYNRGAGMAGERRREMRMLRDAVREGDLRAAARAVRQMKRLWEGQGLDGLLIRREAEAQLIESDLRAGVACAGGGMVIGMWTLGEIDLSRADAGDWLVTGLVVATVVAGFAAAVRSLTRREPPLERELAGFARPEEVSDLAREMREGFERLSQARCLCQGTIQERIAKTEKEISALAAVQEQQTIQLGTIDAKLTRILEMMPRQRSGRAEA